MIDELVPAPKAHVSGPGRRGLPPPGPRYTRSFVSRIPPICLIPLLALAACGRRPGEYPPPPQRPPSTGRDPGKLGNFIRMEEASSDEYIVRDISPERGRWRWALSRPELKFQPKQNRDLKLVVEFAIPDVTFRETGPVVVTCLVNGRELGSVRCPKPGQYRFEKQVPNAWISPGQLVSVGALVDKPFIAKEDGARLSFLLGAAGFPD